jgi:hypothetical protein
MEQQIRNWLQSQGYPLEMRAAAAYRDAGFRVVQSSYYQDPESSDWREIDVVADRTWIAAETNSVPIRIMFVAECKASREKPWILFTAKRALASPSRVVQRVSNPLGHAWLQTVSRRHDIQSLRLFRVSPLPAYGIVQALRGQGAQDPTYGAALSVAKACVALTRGPFQTHDAEWALLAFPMVVTEARLFQCSLNLDNAGEQFELQEVPYGDLVWRNPISQHPNTIMKIVNIDHLEKLMRTTARSASRLVELTLPELANAAGSLDQERKPAFRKRQGSVQT